MKSLEREAPPAAWDSLYRGQRTPWKSGGLSETTRLQLTRYAPGQKLLEVGCGLGDEGAAIARMGFEYFGLDISEAAISNAKSHCTIRSIRFATADFFRWSTDESFNIVYDKGFFHGLAGVRRRNSFFRRVAGVLRPKGIWITVSGSADQRRTDFYHGAIYLRDLVGPAEIYFEVLEVVKAPYGLADQDHDFDAWHAVFRRR